MFFLLFLSMLMWSLPVLGLSSKYTSLSPGFSLCRSRQFDTIWFFIWFFIFSWLITWVDGINGCGWCLTGGRGCWFKGLHQIPSVCWIFHHSLHFHIHQNVHLSQGCHDHGVAIANDVGDGTNDCDWFILGFRWGSRRGGYHNFSVFGLFLIAFWWLVMVAVFVSLLLFLSLICLIRCYMETIVLCKNISTVQIWSLLSGFLHFTSQLDF